MVTSRDVVVDLSVTEVRELLRSGYDLEPDEVEVVSGEVATVCRTRVGDRLLAVKALPGSPDDGHLVRWQTAAVETLARAGLPVPPVVPARDGAPVHESRAAGRTVFTVVSIWLTDPPLAEVAVDDALLDAVGEVAGRVAVAMTEVPGPPVPTQHEWELARTADVIRSVLPRVEDAHVASTARSVADLHDATVGLLLPDLPRSVVHHDLHDANLLVGTTSAGTRGVTGILDFGDMVEGPRIAEYVVAAAYAARNATDPVAALLRVAAGWHRFLPLTDEERDVLLPGAQSRLALNAAVWAARATGPRSAYASSRSTGTMATLERLLGTDPTAFAERLAVSCP